MDIKVATLGGPREPFAHTKISLDAIDCENPRDDEVVVRLTSCGLSGTDCGCPHSLESYADPSVLGHEGAGVVEAVGREVTDVACGDHVIIGAPCCGSCRNCRRGQPRYCEKIETHASDGCCLAGTTPLRRRYAAARAIGFRQQSSHMSYAIAHRLQLTKVPDYIDHDLMGPLGCSVTAGAGAVLNELRPAPGSSIVVFGAGAVGLSAVMAAQLSGASTIIAVDNLEERLALARELGATHAVAGQADAVEEIRELTNGGADFAIECTSGANRVAEAMRALAILGTCAMVGGAGASATVTLDHADTMRKGKRLVGVNGGGARTPEFHLCLMDLQVKGRFPLQKLVRHYDFADLQQAISDCEIGAVAKPILRMH